MPPSPEANTSITHRVIAKEILKAAALALNSRPYQLGGRAARSLIQEYAAAAVAAMLPPARGARRPCFLEVGDWLGDFKCWNCPHISSPTLLHACRMHAIMHASHAAQPSPRPPNPAGDSIDIMLAHESPMQTFV